MQDICDTRRLASPDVCPQNISDTDLETLYYCFKINIIGANLICKKKTNFHFVRFLSTKNYAFAI